MDAAQKRAWEHGLPGYLQHDLDAYGRVKVVCACRDFTVPGKRFYDFCLIKNTVIDSERGGHGTELSDVLTTIDLPQADEPIMRKMLADADELNARIYTFPGSMLKVGGRKINYRDFIAAHAEPGLDEALDRLLPRIGALDFSGLVSDVPYLTGLQRQFLTTYLDARRERIFAAS